MRLEVHQKHITAMLKGGGVQVSKLHSGLVTAGHIAGKQDPEFTLQPPASSQHPSMTYVGGGHIGDDSTLSDLAQQTERGIPTALEIYAHEGASTLFEGDWPEPDYLPRSSALDAELPQPQAEHWDNFYTES